MTRAEPAKRLWYGHKEGDEAVKGAFPAAAVDINLAAETSATNTAATAMSGSAAVATTMAHDSTTAQTAAELNVDDPDEEEILFPPTKAQQPRPGQPVVLPAPPAPPPVAPVAMDVQDVNDLF